MRQKLLVLALVLCVAPFAAAEAPKAPEAVTAPSVESQVTLEDLLAPVPTADPGAACDAPALLDAAAAWCPFGAPECQEHDDCDVYCGHPDFGNCERQGFFPFGCCVCLG